MPLSKRTVYNRVSRRGLLGGGEAEVKGLKAVSEAGGETEQARREARDKEDKRSKRDKRASCAGRTLLRGAPVA